MREHVHWRGERRPGRRGQRQRERRRPGGGPGGEGDAIQGEAQEEALREADSVRLPQGLRRDAAARQGPVRQGARRWRSGATGAGRSSRLQTRPARPRMVPFIAKTYVGQSQSIS